MLRMVLRIDCVQEPIQAKKVLGRDFILHKIHPKTDYRYEFSWMRHQGRHRMRRFLAIAITRSHSFLG